jgi:hypothetical protein
MAATADTMCVTSENRESAVKMLYRKDLNGEVAMLVGGKIPEKCRSFN